MTASGTQGLLGKPEDDQLEFKDAEVMRRPIKVARDVVGFLNADGGVVWIGVKEEQGRAVALQPFENPHLARRSVLDHLIGVVEPAFSQSEVKVEDVEGLIRVIVRRGANRPYAVRDGGRHYLIRVDDRLNEMTREQIGEEFRKADRATRQDVLDLQKHLHSARQEALATESLWLRLAPLPQLTIDFYDKTIEQLLRTWLTDPGSTGNRRSGWNFVNDLRRPQVKGRALQHGDEEDFKRTTITNEGELTFVVALSALTNLARASNRFEPYALLEYPVSVFRLMSKLLQLPGVDAEGTKVIGAFSMNGIRGWVLSPGSPRQPIRWPGPKTYEGKELWIPPEWLELDAKLLRDEPDRCALQLIRLVYGELGFEEDAIPAEFDRSRGVLSFP